MNYNDMLNINEMYIYIVDVNENIYITVMSKDNDYMLWNDCELNRWLMKYIWWCRIRCYEYLIMRMWWVIVKLVNDVWMKYWLTKCKLWMV